MKSQKVILAGALFCLALFQMFSQRNENSSLLQFDTYKVDNEYLNSKDPSYASLGGPLVEYFVKLKGLDVAYNKNNTGDYWGVAAEGYHNIIFYFDSSMRNKKFGYDKNDGRGFFQGIKSVLTTYDGKIYACDQFNGNVYYWDRTKESYEPEGKIDRSFSSVVDLAKDKTGSVFILERGLKKSVYRYNPPTKSWYYFSNGTDRINLGEFYNPDWGDPSGLAVSDNGIYVSYFGGVLVRYSMLGVPEKYYWIDKGNLMLPSSKLKEGSKTWLVSITVDPSGTLYAADANAGLVHVFNKDLEYVSSWNDSDPSRSLDNTVEDIIFYPHTYNCLVSYPWGFYAYKKQNLLSGVGLSETFVYPDYVGSGYPGMGVDLDVLGPGGQFYASVENSQSVYTVQDKTVYTNEHVAFTWTGRDKQGRVVPAGDYTLRLKLNDVLMYETPVQVRPKVGLSIVENSGLRMDPVGNRVTFHYSLDSEVSLTAAVTKGDGEWTEPVLSELKPAGGYAITIGKNLNSRVLSDGQYSLILSVLPSDLLAYDLRADSQKRTFLTAGFFLTLDPVVNSSEGFSPKSATVSSITGTSGLNGAGLVSARVKASDGRIARTLFDQASLSGGAINFTWNGFSDDGQRAADGQYYFELAARQEWESSPILKAGLLFKLDTKPPVIGFSSGSQSVYYLSPNEASSPGIQDGLGEGAGNLECSFTSDKTVTVDVTLQTKTGEPVKSLAEAARMDGGNYLSLAWNGTDSQSAFVKDGAYALSIAALDDLGNRSTTRLPIFVDNNTLDENFPGSGAGEEFLVKKAGAGNLRNPVVSDYSDGYAVLWQEPVSVDDYGYDGTSVYCQYYDKDWNSEDDSFDILSSWASEIVFPAIAKLDDGYIAGAIRRNNKYVNFKPGSIVIRKFYEKYPPYTPPTTIYSSEFSLSNLNILSHDGGYILVFESYDSTSNKNRIGIIFNDNSDRTLAGPIFLAEDTGSADLNARHFSSVIHDGKMTLIWSTANALYGKQFDLTGAAMGAFSIPLKMYSADKSVTPAIIAQEEGYLLVWTEKPRAPADGPGGMGTLYYDSYDGDGGSDWNGDDDWSEWHEGDGGPDGDSDSGGSDSDGNEVPSSTMGGVFYQSVSADLSTRSSDSQVNSVSDASSNFTNPRMVKSGTQIAVTWEALDESNGGTVFGQLFDSQGNRLGANFTIKSSIYDKDLAHALASSEHGFTTVFQQTDDDSRTGIGGQHYSLRTGPTQNLSALFTSPASGDVSRAENNFSVTGLVSDFYLDRYSLTSRIAGDSSSANTILAQGAGDDIDGEIHTMNVLSYAKDLPYLVTLDAWDKAGNHRSDTFTYIRPLSSDDFIEEFSLSASMASANQVPTARIDLKKSAVVTLELRNSGNQTLKSFPLGERSDAGFTHTLSLADINDGTYKVVLLAQDGYGTYTTHLPLSVDNTAPLVSITYFGHAFSTQTDVAVSATIGESNLRQYSLELCRDTGASLKVLKTGQSARDMDSVTLNPLGLEEGSYYLELRALDMANNVASVRYPFAVDRTGPAITLQTPSADEVKRAGIRIAGELSDALGLGEYAVMATLGLQEILLYRGSQPNFDFVWDTAGLPEKVFASGLVVTASDSIGNQASLRRSFAVDNQAPTPSIQFEGRSAFSDGKRYIGPDNRIYLSAESGDSVSGVDRLLYKLDDSGWISYEEPLRVFGAQTHTLAYKAYDSTGNESPELVDSFTLDATPPVPNLEVLGPHFEGDGAVFLGASALLNVSASDGPADTASGLGALLHRLDDGEWSAAEMGPMALSQEGLHSLSVKAVDSVGNELVKVFGPFIVDLAPPQTLASSGSKLYHDSSTGIMALSTPGFVSLNAVDTGDPATASGVKATLCDLDGSGEIPYTQALPIDAGKRYFLKFRSEDRVSNRENVQQYDVEVDTLPPEILESLETPFYERDTLRYVKDLATIKLTASDNFSGVDEVLYRAGAGDELPYPDRIYLSDEGLNVFSYRAKDRVGNESAPMVSKVFVDSTPPVSTIGTDRPVVDLNGELFADARTVFTLSAGDSGSGVARTTILLNGIESDSDQFVLEAGRAHSVSYYSEDEVGNVEAERSFVVTAEALPALKIHYSPPIFQNQVPSPELSSGNNKEIRVSSSNVNTSFSVSVNGAELVPQPQTLPGAPAEAGGAKSYAVFYLPPLGVFDVTVTGTDLYGNRASVAAHYDFNFEVTNQTPDTQSSHSASYAFDGDPETYWQLASGSAGGWFEASWYEAQQLAGAEVDLVLPPGVLLQIHYLNSGRWVPLSGSVLVGPKDGISTLTFPGNLAPTEKVLITVHGPEAASARIREIRWKNGGTPKPYGKILPKTYAFNQTEYISLKADRLWDGISGNSWYEPLWYTPWEPLQTDDANKPQGVFPPYYGHPTSPGEIVWYLDGDYEIDTLKAYFLVDGRGLKFEFWDGENWTNARSFAGGTSRAGWQTLRLASAVVSDRIRISFPSGWEMARYIGELEVWGAGWEKELALPIPTKAGDGAYHFTIDQVFQIEKTLEVRTVGLSGNSLTGALNDRAFTVSPFSWAEEETVYRIPLYPEGQRADVQFLSLTSDAPLSAVVVKVADGAHGKVDLGWPYNDRRTERSIPGLGYDYGLPEVKTRVWNLGNEYRLEKLRVYSKMENPPAFKTGLTGTYSSVMWASHAGDVWIADMNGRLADQLVFESDTPVLLDEIEVLGTATKDTKLNLDLWWPPQDPSKPVTSSASDYNSVIGWMGDPQVQPTLNGYHPRQADKMFWMPLSQMGLVPGEEKQIILKAALGELTGEKTFDLKWILTAPATLDQGIGFLSTGDGMLRLSGSVHDQSYRCFIDGEEVLPQGGLFSVDHALRPGFQEVKVEIWDSQKHRLLVSWAKPVYFSEASPELLLDQPSGDQWVQKEEVTVSGRVGGGVGLVLTINGIEVPVIGNAFEQTFALESGTNGFLFRLEDESGGEVIKNLRVYRQ